MRTQRLNKTDIWVVSSNGYTDVLDGNGFKTGERELTYSVPQKIKLSLVPTNGRVYTDEKGLIKEFDKTTVTNIDLKVGDLLFLSEPTGEYDSTYDYSIDMKLDSLNINKYGLMRKR